MSESLPLGEFTDGFLSSSSADEQSGSKKCRADRGFKSES